MARIPLQIAERSLGTGSVVQYPSGSPVGAALEGFGNSLQSAALRVKEKQDQKDAFDAAIRENEMTADIAMMEDEAGRNIAADGSGLHDGVYGQIDPATDTAVKPGSFDALFDSYLSRMPESKRQDFAAKRDLYRKQGSVRLAGKQYEAEQAYYKVEIQKTHNQIANAIGAIDPNDTATFEAFRSQGVDIIDKSGLPALEKDVAKVNWIANADETLFKTRLAKDPDFATKARAALGLAPSESSVTGAPAIQSVVDRIIGNESSGDPNAQNPRSSAGGLGGFIDSTWVATVRKFRPDIARGMSNDQIIELKTNGQLAREMTTRHVEENAGALQASGLSPSARNLYLAHFLGQSGAASLLSADDGAAVSSVVSAEAVKANPEVLGGGKTVGDVKAWAAMKMGGVESDMPKMATGPVPPVQFIDQTAGKIRDKPVQGWVKDGIARAAFATDSRISVMVVSGGQSAKGEGGKRTGSTRHDHGDAADIVLMLDGKPVKPGENKELYAAFFRNAAANGFTGLGHYEWGIHVGGGAQAVWGPDRTSGTLDPTFAKAAADGWGNPVAKGKGGDPQYANIPFERKLVLANQADVQVAEMQRATVAQQKADYATYKDAIELQIVQGKVKDEAIVSNDGILNDGDKATLLRAVQSQNKENAGVDALLSAISEGGKVNVNPFDADQARIGDKAYDQLVSRVPEDQKQAVGEAYVAQTGYLPKHVAAQVRQGISSLDPATAGAGMERAARLYQVAPVAMETGDNASALKDAALAYQEYVYGRGMSRDEAGKRWADLHSPEAVQQRERLKEPAKEFLKTLDVSEVTGALDTSVLPFSDPSAGLTPDQQAAIMTDYAKIAEEKFLMAGGDGDLAKKLAIADMTKLYGVSVVAGSDTVMKFPPERYYPVIGEGHDYIREMALGDVKTVAPNAENVMLIPTKETVDDIRLKRPPRYAIRYQTPEGVWDEIPGQRFSVPADELNRRMEQDREERINAARLINRAETESRMRELEAQRAADEALQNTVGPDWMKAKGAEAAREQVIQTPTAVELDEQAKRDEQARKMKEERDRLLQQMRPGGGAYLPGQ